MGKSIFFGSDIFRRSVYGNGHPLDIARVWPVIDICRAQGWLTHEDYQEVLPASPELLSHYHDAGYVAALQDAEKNQSLPDELRDRYNIGKSSNPIFPEVYRRPATAAHASVLGARAMISGEARYVFNPSGGTHHGRKDAAYGFCFVNDPAIAIAECRHLTDKRLCYVDLDAHHCDGVQDWHHATSHLKIISVHQEGLWPRTGLPDDVGGGNAVNVHLPAGADDTALSEVMRIHIMPRIAEFDPDYIILQAGADGHRDDPQSKLCYSLQGYWEAVHTLLATNLPMMILGGGGYNPYITAKAWAGLWGLIIGKDPADEALSEASIKLLKQLSWHHRLGRTPPLHWTESFADPL